MDTGGAAAAIANAIFHATGNASANCRSRRTSSFEGDATAVHRKAEP